MLQRILLLMLLLAGGAAWPQSAPRYTFSWPLNAEALQPRGGTTRGPELQLDTAESDAWRKLQVPGIAPFERDRRAILAMAGSYRVSFDFLEVLQFQTNASKQRPYQSWGTEKVYVDRDEGGFISLVHILEMRIQKENGSLSDPIVTKHWRQDWRYEPDSLVEYQGNATWKKIQLSAAQRKGRWSQTVYQVDESPRYASLGAWQHASAFSTWISGDTWRPLPRREWSVRKDYSLLSGTNRHTITTNGWVQEENNLKSVLNADHSLTHIAREYGFSRYERLKDPDFAAADRYYGNTRAFWSQVRDAWSEWFERESVVRLRGQVDELGLFAPLFQQADAINDDAAAGANNAAVIRKALEAMRP